MKMDDLPFPLGTTYFDGQTADTTTKEALNLEGKEYLTEDILVSAIGGASFSSTKLLRTAYLKRVRIMRNVSGVALQGGYLAAPQEGGTDGRYFLGRVNGYSNVGAKDAQQTIPAYGIDEFIPSAGVPNNDLFYATVEGPFLGVSSSTAAEILGISNSGAAQPIQVGDVLYSTTAAASTNTTNLSTATCGRIANFTASTSGGLTLAFNILNRIGRALSALTTTQTNTSVLMYFTKF